MTTPPRRRRTLLLALLALLLIPVLVPSSAHADRRGPGHVAVPGFSGYVTRRNAELGTGRLRNGIVGICLDTGPGLGWPAGTPRYVSVLNPRAAYLTARYLERARHDAQVAAALWWVVGGTLRLNSHPDRVADHVAQLHDEAPRFYAGVRAWHDRMLTAARRDAAGRHGYTTGLRLTRLDRAHARLSGIGVRSGTHHWIGSHRVTIRLSGATFPDGTSTWTGTSRRSPRELTVRTRGTAQVQARETVSGLPSARFHRYAATASTTQRVAAAAPLTRVGATAVAAPVRVPLQVVKTAEQDDPAGLIGVAVAVHARTVDGPVLERHTFTAGDVHDGRASFTTAATYDPDATYVVALTSEPDGWVPEASSVPAVAAGHGLIARLVDDRIWQPQLVTQASANVVRPGASLHDRVSVSDTGGHTLEGAWRLLGPVRPGSHGCDRLDWSASPVAAGGTFTVIGDGTQVLGSARVDGVGCYTYVEQLSGNRTTLPVAWTTPGVVPETTLVRASPSLTTTVSRQSASAGEVISDRVRLSGLGAGATPPIQGEWQLLGPVAPSIRSECHHLSWAKAPVAAHGTFAVRRDGALTVGRTRLRAGGCYTYRERLAATPTSSPAGWTTPGVVAETTVVHPHQPTVPPHPAVPAGGARPSVVDTLIAGSVRLGATGLRATLHPVSFQGAVLDPPADIGTAGLWSGGASLDAVVGTTVLVGHVSDDRDRPGAFHRLWPARVGQRIDTVAADGAVTRWRITHVGMTPKGSLARGIFTQGLARRLVLVTCSDEVHYAGGRFHYRSNLVVEAVPQ